MDTIRQPPYMAQGGASSQQPAQTEDHLDAVIHAYWHTLIKRKFVILSAILFCVGVSFFINLTQTPVYQSSSELVVEPKVTGDPTQDASASNLMRDPTFLMTQMRLIQSRKFSERTLAALAPSEQLSLLESNGRGVEAARKKAFVLSKSEKSFLAGVISRSLSLRQVVAGARVLEIAVTGYAPAICAKLTDAVAEMYVLMNYESHIDLFKKRFSMTNKSLSEISEKIKTSELALEKINTEIKLYEALKVYGEKYPDVVSLRSSIQSLGLQLEEMQRNLQESEVGQRQNMLTLIVKPHLELLGLQDVVPDLINLKSLLEQETAANREIYNSIYKRLREMEVTGGSTIWVDMKIIRQAGVPYLPIRPNKKMNTLLSLFIGFFMGVSLAFFLEYLDSSIRSVDDVKSYLRVNALGMVPEVEFENVDMLTMKGVAEKEGSTRVMWSTNDLKIPLYVAEAYRIIRTNFVFGAVDKSLKIFQVTSAVKGEGKTTTTVNLGISLSQVGLKVLLVDADLRRPSIHKTLHLNTNTRGLDQLLNGEMSLEGAVQQTPVPNLSVLTSGGIPNNPSELLSSNAMRDLMVKLRTHFDVILIDSPPVISVADAPVIASHVDGTILVVRAGYIPRRLTMQAKRSIEAVNGKVLGIVLNSVSSSHHPYYYYRYYTDNYYTYYGDESKKGSKRKKKSPIHDERVSPLEKIRLSFFPQTPKPIQNVLFGNKNIVPAENLKEKPASNMMV